MNAPQTLSRAGRAALACAREGWPVFPCEHRLERCKRPLTRHGFKDATTDPFQVETWWRQWPDAMIGVPPGKLIGFWVLDVDVDPDKGIDGAAALARLEAEHGPLPRTCESRTPRGGRHLLFNWDPARPIMNRRGTLPDGIDVRGDGGYFIVPPSRREDGASYRWENLQDEPVEAPEWLYDLIRLKPERTATAANLRSTGAGEETYARTVLDGAARDVAAAPSGKRNDTLNAVAYRLGRMIARDWLSREEVELRLLAAAHACGLVVDDGEHAARATIQSGIEAGIQEPHGDLKDREQSEPFEPKPNGEAIDEVGIGVSLDDFVAYMPAHSYIFKPTREMWPAASVNARLPKTKIRMDRDGTPIYISASTWLDKYSPVEQMTWSPGETMLIKDKLIADGGWIERHGCTVFNLYRPPTIQPRAGLVDLWRDHIVDLYGDDAEHIIRWLAHRVQHPDVKINHALALGGLQGIGKDTILEPVKQAIGPWNFSEVTPQQMLGRFNGFTKSVILRASEARDLGDLDRYAFYDHSKSYIASPPDVLRVDEKHLREYAIPNVTGLIITTNHKTNGIYLPADDRRHFVAWSDKKKADFTPEYWNEIWHWYEHGGSEAVAHYLLHFDLSYWNPKAPPPKTAAFHEIVASSRAPEDAEMADALEALEWPEVTTLQHIKDRAAPEFAIWLSDRKNSRLISHRLEACGYIAVSNDGQKIDGRWKIGGKNVVVYARSSMSLRDRINAARRFVEARRGP